MCRQNSTVVFLLAVAFPLAVFAATPEAEWNLIGENDGAQHTSCITAGSQRLFPVRAIRQFDEAVKSGNVGFHARQFAKHPSESKERRVITA